MPINNPSAKTSLISLIPGLAQSGLHAFLPDVFGSGTPAPNMQPFTNLMGIRSASQAFDGTPGYSQEIDYPMKSTGGWDWENDNPAPAIPGAGQGRR